jgi:hypothetical protein
VGGASPVLEYPSGKAERRPVQDNEVEFRCSEGIGQAIEERKAIFVEPGGVPDKDGDIDVRERVATGRSDAAEKISEEDVFVVLQRIRDRRDASQDVCRQLFELDHGQIIAEKGETVKKGRSDEDVAGRSRVLRKKAPAGPA